MFYSLLFSFTCLFPYCPSHTVGQIRRKVSKLLVSCIVSNHFVVSLFHPMGNLNQSAADTYQTNALTNGVLEGYNTVDAVALLALSVTLSMQSVTLVSKIKVTELTAKAGSLSVALEVMIYLVLFFSVR